LQLQVADLNLQPAIARFLRRRLQKAWTMPFTLSTSRTRKCGKRPGAVLIEFALISLALMLLLGLLLDFSRAFHGSQVLQQAADVAARELARTPLPASYTFEDALFDPKGLSNGVVRQKIYDENFLVIDLDNFAQQGFTRIDQLPLPLVNQQLLPLMIYEHDPNTGHNLVRYPGAVPNPTPSSSYPYQYVIYLVSYQNGAEVIDPNNTVPVVEEIRGNPKDPTTGSFSLTSSAPNPGYVQLRINYPFQAAAISNYQGNAPVQQEDQHGRITGDRPVIQASDGVAGLEQSNPLLLYSGPEGLGQQYAWAKIVRPYRKVLGGQAIARRELFSGP
jgi:TadE-like protein